VPEFKETKSFFKKQEIQSNGQMKQEEITSSIKVESKSKPLEISKTEKEKSIEFPSTTMTYAGTTEQITDGKGKISVKQKKKS